MLGKTEIELFKRMCSGLSVMIVEDEVALANHYRTLAQSFFADITVVNDAYSALAEYKPGRFDIIYTDINMPRMNGVELIKKIKEADPKQHFIVMSASNESNNLLELLRLRISIFILKPFQLDEFVKGTSEQIAILQQSRQMSETARQMEAQLLEVTKEKQMQEDMLIQQSKLAQTGEMIAMIAHQWRQPLSSITTQVATLKTRMDLGAYDALPSPYEALSEDLHKSFEKIEGSAMFLSKTINNFRNFYRPDNIQNVFNLKASIDAVLEMLMLEQNNITIEKDYHQGPDLLIESYEGELQQGMMSIINNARDALVENEIENPKVTIAVKTDEERVIIEIRDNAGGIPEEIIDNIFLPYFSTKSKKNGTGIGLHMTKTIVETHMQGSLSVYNSTQEGGACFRIDIPIKRRI